MFQELFYNKKPVIGMVHLKALPGSPGCTDSWEEIIGAALEDAEFLCDGGVDGIQIENQFDWPFLLQDQIGAETTAFLTAAGCALHREHPQMPFGINIHLNGGIQALAAAKACKADWIRVFNLANGYISNSGYVDALGPKLLRYRQMIGAEHVMIFGDFQVKHGSHAVTADRTLWEKAHDVEMCMADAAVITGSATGKAPDAESIQSVKAHLNIPLLIGSGLNGSNVKELWPYIDGAVIGSGFKKGADLHQPVDRELVRRFMETVHQLDRISSHQGKGEADSEYPL